MPQRLWSLMEILRVYAEQYVGCASMLDSLSDSMVDDSAWGDLKLTSVLTVTLKDLDKLCVDGDLPVTAVLIGKISKAVELGLADEAARELFRIQGIAKMIKEVRPRMIDEMSTKLFLQLPSSKRAYFDTPLKGWDEVAGRFPETIRDIEEMSRCFSLSRYPAAVFHSLQAVESTLIHLGVFLMVRDPKSGWTSVCNELSRIVTGTKFTQLQDYEKRHFAFLEQVHATATCLKNAWRNKIDHSMNKLTLLTADFSPDIAEEIILASRSFMRRLAAELPQGVISQ